MNNLIKMVLVFGVLLLFGVAWRYVAFYAGMHYMNSAVNDAMAPMVARAQRDAYVARSRAEHHAPAPQGRMLADDEKCIDGTIVRVEQIDGVPTYTQMNDGARPLACPE